MSVKHLLDRPCDIPSVKALLGQAASGWWYEEPSGVSLYLAGVLIPPLQSAWVAFIPWRELRAALNRRDRKDVPRKKPKPGRRNRK